MRAEIVAIGSELVSGQGLDTNSQWLSRALEAHGIPVAFHTTIGDQLDDHVSTFRIAAGRAELVIMTGGLGPTQDDLTREALAATAGVSLREDPGSLAAIRTMFARRNRPM
ncbi:MAG: competence/damage-inducible protein A, partial [Isosphaeraceae bacterium]